HGNAVSLPRLIVGKRHCRVLIVGNGKVRRLDRKTIKYLAATHHTRGGFAKISQADRTIS
ncbi:hypothetical protein QT971_24655, partial [Microcoleus sp. herbarium19]|uniref:hypothetical protein n=1 Tax=Microcoleus sp. herbarium19 TaxID=3055440 RepID=UPI002FD02A5F